MEYVCVCCEIMFHPYGIRFCVIVLIPGIAMTVYRNANPPGLLNETIDCIYISELLLNGICYFSYTFHIVLSLSWRELVARASIVKFCCALLFIK